MNHLKDDVTRDDSQERFLAQHSVATLFRMVTKFFQHCYAVYAKTRRCESSRLTLPQREAPKQQTEIFSLPMMALTLACAFLMKQNNAK